MVDYCRYGLLLFLPAIFGCGSSDVVQETSAEDRFKTAMEEFDDRDFLQAITEFRTVTLQYPGSALADDAQYYLGECHFQRGEYLLAAYEYGEVRRSFPASPLVPDAQYKLADSYYQLSPPARLDQRYTLKAKDELQAFIEYYPSHEKAVEANQKIQELTDKLAEKAYSSALLYERMERYRAALHYFDNIIERFHDTDYAPLSYLGKAEILVTRKRFIEAKTTIQKFLALFPNSVLRGRGDALLDEIEGELSRNGASSVTSGDSQNSNDDGLYAIVPAEGLHEVR